MLDLGDFASLGFSDFLAEEGLDDLGSLFLVGERVGVNEAAFVTMRRIATVMRRIRIMSSGRYYSTL